MTDRFIHSSQGYLSEVEDHGIEATKFDEHIYHIMLQSGRMYNAESNRWVSHSHQFDRILPEKNEE